MFGLAEEVGRAHLAVDAVVGDDERLGRAGKEIDPDAAEELALRLGHKGVAGPNQHIDGRDRVWVPSAMAPTAWTPPRQ